MSSLADISARKINGITKKKPDKNDTPLSFKKILNIVFSKIYQTIKNKEYHN